MVGKIVGFGNPLLDISTPVDDAIFDKYSLKKNDAILAEEAHKPLYAELETVYEKTVKYLAGGACQNTMRVAKWVGKDNVEVDFFGCVGKDANAKVLADALKSDSVTAHYRVEEEQKTGVCATLLSGVERSLVTDLSAANHYKLDHTEVAENKAVIDAADFYYITGYFLTVSTETIVKIGQTAKAANKPFLFNLSAPFLPQFFKDQLASVLPYVDVLFGNETEALAYAEANKLETTDLKEIALKLAAVDGKTARTVVITQGSKETIVAKEGKVTVHDIIPLAASEIVDSNGAGDAFVGGFLSQFAQAKAFETCIAAGNFAASHILKNDGTAFDKSLAFEQ